MIPLPNYYLYVWLKKDLNVSRKKCSTFPKQFSLLFNNIFNKEFLTTATMFLKTITGHDSNRTWKKDCTANRTSRGS